MEKDSLKVVDKIQTLVEFEAIKYNHSYVVFSKLIKHDSNINVIDYLDKIDKEWFIIENDLSVIINYSVDDLHVLIEEMRYMHHVSDDFIAQILAVYHRLNESNSKQILSKLTKRETLKLILNILNITLDAVSKTYSDINNSHNIQNHGEQKRID